MKTILTTILLYVSLFATVNFDLKHTYQTYSNNVQDGYSVYDTTNKTEASINFVNNYKNFTSDIKISNRLADEYLERALLKYDGRYNKYIYNISIGTLSTMEGIFNASNDSRVQPPMVNKASGVYNDEWISGLLDTVIGTEFSLGYISNYGLFSVSSSVADIRITDKNKAESAVFNYVSDNVELETVDKIRTTKLKYDSTNINMFVSTTNFKLKSYDTSGLSDLEKKTIYILDRDNFDNAWLTVTNIPYEFQIDRFGAMYTNTKYVIAYEKFRMRTTNIENKTNIINVGNYIYTALYTIDDITPYYSYGWSENNKENVVGVRTHIDDKLILMTEFKKTDWVQVQTKEQYDRYVGDLKVYTVQLIYVW